MSQQISNYHAFDATTLPEDFERRTKLMADVDMPALKDGLVKGTTTAAYNAWNEQTNYAIIARDIQSNTTCKWQ
jgi:hypothetical protein